MSTLTSIAQAAKRSLRRTRRRIRGAKVRFVFHRDYALGVSGVPHDAFRAERILSSLASAGILNNEDIEQPRTASYRDLARAHSETYLDQIHEPGALTKVLGIEVDEAEHERIIDMYRLMTGGTVRAISVARSQPVVGVNLAGGFHHASPARGHGFCLFNDIAVGIRHLRSIGFDGRVIVIDLDVHDGDGTREFFRDDDTVHTFSIHNHDMDDGYRATEDTRIALGADVDDATYLTALKQALPPVLRRFRPDLAIYLAGTDAAVDDRIGDWNIGVEGMLERDHFVTACVRESSAKNAFCVLLAGGYSPHGWRYSARYFSELVSGESIEPPTTEEMTMRRFDHLRRLLDPAALTGVEDPDNPFSLSEEELLFDLQVTRKQTRFLGYYTRHGMELALERYGLFDQLRSLGYSDPRVVFQFDTPGEEIMRIVDGDDPEPLVELLALRDRSSVPGCELMRIEWLLLQNPRASFTSKRPRLPGQNYPGLGLVNEVWGLLLVACQRLKLDGILFVPAHFHIAGQAKDTLRFLEPEDAARFDAVQQAVANLDRVDQSWAIEEHRVIDESTDAPFQWTAMPMLLPVSDRIRSRLNKEEYKTRYEAAFLGQSFYLV